MVIPPVIVFYYTAKALALQTKRIVVNFIIYTNGKKVDVSLTKKHLEINTLPSEPKHL